MAVPATSLSELNQLAANPPQYPHNPTERQREPLTLYISRVPGTRDIILSTLKPQRKNVTAEDIANALYYIHLDQPSDSLLISPPAPSASAATGGRDHGSSSSPRSSSDQPRSSPIHRKPLPAKLPVAQQSPLAGTETEAETVTAGTTATAATQAAGQLPDEPLPQLPPRPPQLQPQQQRPPPPQPSRPPRQPWVPPGFHLDEDHRFQAVDSPEVQPPNVSGAPATGQPQQLITRSPSIPRKPVGPRALGGTTSSTSLASVSSFQTATADLTQQQQQQQQQQRPLPPLSPLSPRSSLSPRSPLSPRSRSPAFVPFQLTLIRRDPSSNHQWNVGKISSLQAVDAPGGGANGSSGQDRLDQQAQPEQQPQPTISIRLDTSGYAKFRGFPTRHSIEAASRGVTTLQDVAAAASAAATANRESRAESSRDESGFARQVVMSYGKSWTANLRHAFRRHDRSTSDTSAPDADVEADRQRQQQRRPLSHGHPYTSGDSLLTVDTTAASSRDRDGQQQQQQQQHPLITRPGPGLKPRGYVFASPWDGQCEFRTGNGGRSLKCRHFVHTDGGGSGGGGNGFDGGGGGSGGAGAGGGGRPAGFNPLVLAQNIRDGQSVAAAAVSAAGGRARAGSLTAAITGAAAVSELRFNLPSGELFRKGEEGGHGGHGGRSDLYGWMHSHHRRSTSSDDGEGGDSDDYDDGDDEALALALGREAAGGGNRGKRAKLGKLIIYDDGFKMLDLVVAANMGMWWVAWEKSF